MKRVAILGSTGSIGTQALDVVERHRERFSICALSAGTRVSELIDQARRFAPPTVVCAREEDSRIVASALDAHTRILWGAAGLVAAAADSGADVVLVATDGAVSFDAAFAAVDRGIDLAVANKELIVAAGELLIARAKLSGAAILPVDSEHSAIFQCLVGEPNDRIATVVLTASGGPFWTADAETIRNAGVEQALRHPTWQMGTKNTIDSATMMNKGLEVIEASRLFNVGADRIAVFVHRTSVAHGFVIFTDGNVKAQLAPPDMRLPIGYALAYPDRLDDRRGDDPLSMVGAAAGETVAKLEFERPDFERFPALGLAFEALRRGGTIPAALSAANEIAVKAFVDRRIRFGGIAEVVQSVIQSMPDQTLTLVAVRAADARARELARLAVDSIAMPEAAVQASNGSR